MKSPSDTAKRKSGRGRNKKRKSNRKKK